MSWDNFGTLERKLGEHLGTEVRIKSFNGFYSFRWVKNKRIFTHVIKESSIGPARIKDLYDKFRQDLPEHFL